jgi:hypothetical protein
MELRSPQVELAVSCIARTNAEVRLLFTSAIVDAGSSIRNYDLSGVIVSFLFGDFIKKS